MFPLPQDINAIKEILEEAKVTKNKPPLFPELADDVDANVEENDARLFETEEDGACLVYSLFYVIYRDPVLKEKFHQGVRKDSENYYFYIRVAGDMYTFRIPISLVIHEKEHNQNRIYPTNWEYLLALSILCHVIEYMKNGWIDECAFQPLLSTDMFFDRPFELVGDRTDIEASCDLLLLKTDKITATLTASGEVELDGKEMSRRVFLVGFYPEGWDFGHSIVIYFNYQTHRWTYYSCSTDTKHQTPGEKNLSEMIPMKFNGLCLMCDFDIV